MPRPNLAQDAPPAEISVGGVLYKINVDFRVWIGVLLDLRDLISTPMTPEQAMHNAEVLIKIEKAVFGKTINQPPAEVINAIVQFSQGYPEAPIGEGKGNDVQTYSLDWDLNYIIIAIMNQFGDR